MEDEDYWNSSKTTGFCFDDDDIAPVLSLFDAPKSATQTERLTSSSIFGNFTELQSGSKPIECLLTKRSLSIVIGNTVEKKRPQHSNPTEELSILRKQVASLWEAPPAADTIRAIILSKPFSLHLYQSLESKTTLLHEAVKSGDGNAVLAVVLFLQKTLKNKLFYNLLLVQPSAVPVYINYLSTRYEFKTAVELLLMLGQPRDAAMKEFQFAIQPHQNIDKRLMKLKYLQRDHYSIQNAEDRLFVDNFFQYVEWQVSSAERQGPLSGTVIATLAYLCSHHWEQIKGQPLSPLTLVDLLAISERSYHWTAIATRAALSKWDDISNLVLTKGWLGGKKLKTVVTADRIVMELHRRQAPEQRVYEYFALVESQEKQLELGRKLNWHRAVIDTLVAMRDRQGLVQYQASMNPQSSDYIYGESLLRANTKWKN